MNYEIVALYWYIGGQIIEKQKTTNWGYKLLEALSSDLRHSFPETKGFSPTSLKRMRMFAAYYPQIEFGSQPVTQLPWGHIQFLLFKIKDEKVRAWYAAQCLENGWSRPTLEKYIKNDLFTAQGCQANKATNSIARLPTPQSTFVQDMLFYNLPLRCFTVIDILCGAPHKSSEKTGHFNFALTPPSDFRA